MLFGKNSTISNTPIKINLEYNITCYFISIFVSQVIEDKTLVTKYGSHLAEHFKTINDYKTAEKLYMECGMHREAINLYLETGKLHLFIVFCKR